VGFGGIFAVLGIFGIFVGLSWRDAVFSGGFVLYMVGFGDFATFSGNFAGFCGLCSFFELQWVSFCVVLVYLRGFAGIVCFLF